MGQRSGPIFWGLVLIGVGVLFLVQQMSDGGFSVGEFLARWWPLLLVLFGLWFVVQSLFARSWSGGPADWSGGPGRWGPSAGAAGAGPGWAAGERVSVDLQGADSAELSLSFGAGVLAIGRASSGKLVEGTFAGGVRAEQGGPGRVRLTAESPWGWGPAWWRRDWRAGVTGEVPLPLTVETGASRNDLDLGDLRVTDLSVRTGASETTIRLPRAAGLTRARLDAGAASVRVYVPDGVAVRILGRMQIGTNDIDTRRFPATTTGWSSPDFETAANRVELAISGGLATLQVR